MTTEFVAFQGRGPVRIAPYGSENFQRVGNNSQLEFSIELSEISQIDFESEAGGEADSQSNISSVTAGLNILSFTSDNIARAVRGSVTVAPVSAQTDEAHNAYPGALCPFTYNPDSGETLTVAQNGGTWAATTAYVADSDDPANASWVYAGTHIYECTTGGASGGSEPTWPTDGSTVNDGTAVWTDRGAVDTLTVDVDYSITRSGIEVPVTGSKIVAGMPIKVTYTPLGNQKIIEALVNSGSEYVLVFDGMNFAKNNRPCTVICHRVKFSPTTGLGFVSENYGEMPNQIKILKDDSITGQGLSKYFQVRWHDA